MANLINIIQGTNLGGMEQASLRLMKALKRRGHSFTLLSLNPIGALGPLLAESEIPAVGLPYLGRGGWRSLLLMRKALGAAEADALLMTGHNLMAMVGIGRMAHPNRVLAIHFHHQGVKPEWQWRLIYRIARIQFRAITFPSDFIRREAEAIYPPIKAIAHTVYNPMPAWPLPDRDACVKARLALGLPLDVPIVGNAGWLIPRKRFDVFLRTAALVLEQRPDTLFVVAGDGELREALEALAAELGITKQIRWLGWQRDMLSFYHCLDVMLFNSDWDAVGLTPLEAINSGVPLVGSVVQGGLGEIINSDQYGYLLNSHDTRAMADRVVGFLDHPETARAVALAGRERVLSVSDPEAIADKMSELLGITCACCK
jgi:glycosyltransferase involved in cell wall biosynthesis